MMSSCCTITPVYIYDDIYSGLLERVVLSTVDFLQNQITIHVIVEFFLPFFTTLNSEAPSGASFLCYNKMSARRFHRFRGGRRCIICLNSL